MRIKLNPVADIKNDNGTDGAHENATVGEFGDNALYSARMPVVAFKKWSKRKSRIPRLPRLLRWGSTQPCCKVNVW